MLPRCRWTGVGFAAEVIVNKERFLVLPWERSKNLASRILGMALRRLSDDWMKRYNYWSVLAETFVQKERFSATSFNASNCLCVGETRCRGKLDVKHEHAMLVKTAWLYPLIPRFRACLPELEKP